VPPILDPPAHAFHLYIGEHVNQKHVYTPTFKKKIQERDHAELLWQRPGSLASLLALIA